MPNIHPLQKSPKLLMVIFRNAQYMTIVNTCWVNKSCVMCMTVIPAIKGLTDTNGSTALNANNQTQKLKIAPVTTRYLHVTDILTAATE